VQGRGYGAGISDSAPKIYSPTPVTLKQVQGDGCLIAVHLS
jgi:hypothetical protein